MAQRLHTGFVFTFYLLLILNKVRCELVENRKVANTFCSIEKHMLPVGGKKKKVTSKVVIFSSRPRLASFISTLPPSSSLLCARPLHILASPILLHLASITICW